MIERILKAVGASAVATVLALGMVWSASASVIEVEYFDENGAGTADQLDGGETAEIRHLQVDLGFLGGGALIGESIGVSVGDVEGGDFLVGVIDPAGEGVSGNGKGFYDLTLVISDDVGVIGTFILTDNEANAGVQILFNFLLSFKTNTVHTFALFGEAFGQPLSAKPNYSITVTAVPLPAAALLFGSALLGGGLMRRRKMIKKFGLPA